MYRWAVSTVSLYTHTIKSPNANGWLEVDLPLDAFTANGNTLSRGERSRVVVMKAFYPVERAIRCKEWRA